MSPLPALPTLATLAAEAAIALLFPPLLLGIINRVKAFFAGRSGPPLVQTYRDIAKLLRKGTVLSTTTTWLFRAGPVAFLASTILALALIPIGPVAALIAFRGDLVLFAYLMAFGRFFTVAAALDTGSSFEGMGGAREVTFAALAEPATFLALLALARAARALSLSAMLGPHLAALWADHGATLVLVTTALFVVLLAENCRVPFDDPNTHLELTMIHEVMVLDHGGPALALINLGSALKMFALGALIVRIALPWTTGHVALDLGLFLAGMVALAVAVGVVESVMARLRLTQVPTLLVGACILASFGILLLLR